MPIVRETVRAIQIKLLLVGEDDLKAWRYSCKSQCISLTLVQSVAMFLRAKSFRVGTCGIRAYVLYLLKSKLFWHLAASCVHQQAQSGVKTSELTKETVFHSAPPTPFPTGMGSVQRDSRWLLQLRFARIVVQRARICVQSHSYLGMGREGRGSIVWLYCVLVVEFDVDTH